MFKLKDYPDSFKKKQSKGWLRFKRRYKRKTNKAIRRNIKNYKKFKGYEIEW